MKLSKFMKFMKNVTFIILRGRGLSLSYVGPPWASHKLPRQSPKSMKSPSWSSSFAFLPVVLGFRNVVRGFREEVLGFREVVLGFGEVVLDFPEVVLHYLHPHTNG